MAWIMNIAILTFGVALIGFVIVLMSVRRKIYEWWRVWQYRRQFRPPPAIHEYRPIRLDLPDYDATRPAYDYVYVEENPFKRKRRS